MQYRTPANFLASLVFEFDDARLLFGITTRFAFQAPGSHRIFPYCTGGVNFNTRSTEDSVVGSLGFGGLLVGDLPLLRSFIFDNVGVIQYSGVRLRVSDITSSTPLMHVKLQDWRVGSISLDTTIFGNTTMVSGTFSTTFRDFYKLPI